MDRLPVKLGQAVVVARSEDYRHISSDARHPHSGARHEEQPEDYGTADSYLGSGSESEDDSWYGYGVSESGRAVSRPVKQRAKASCGHACGHSHATRVPARPTPVVVEAPPVAAKAALPPVDVVQDEEPTPVAVSAPRRVRTRAKEQLRREVSLKPTAQ